MHSFSFVLVAATAFSTLSSAAPIEISKSVTVPSLSNVEALGDSVTDTLHARSPSKVGDVVAEMTNKLKGLHHGRSILDDLTSELGSVTDETDALHARSPSKVGDVVADMTNKLKGLHHGRNILDDLTSELGSVTDETDALHARSPSKVGDVVAEMTNKLKGLHHSRSILDDLTSELGSVTDETDALRARSPSKVGDVVAEMTNKLKGLHHGRNILNDLTSELGSVTDEANTLRAREVQLSVAAIFKALSIAVQPFDDKLTSITSSDATVAVISDIVTSIKTPILKATADLKALVGADLSVIYASADGAGTLNEETVANIAVIVGAEVDAILSAAGNVLSVTADADVTVALKGLGETVVGLVEEVELVVSGLSDVIKSQFKPVEDVIVKLDLDL